MFPDFKTRSFNLKESQIRYPDRLAKLVPVMVLALCCKPFSLSHNFGAFQHLIGAEGLSQ